MRWANWDSGNPPQRCSARRHHAKAKRLRSLIGCNLMRLSRTGGVVKVEEHWAPAVSNPKRSSAGPCTR
jgi:hypothetical protein